MTLLERVGDHLRSHHIPFAVIGAGALAIYGVSRSTLDQDLLVVDDAVLNAAFWSSVASDTAVDVRRGDSDDPLRGVVRCRREGERDVDVVVGRDVWQREVLARARVVSSEGAELPVVEAADLVLLKLYAGGSQDRWDIEQLLASDEGRHTIRVVDERVSALPLRCRALWDDLRPGRA